MYYDRPWTFLLPEHLDLGRFHSNVDYPRYIVSTIARKMACRDVDEDGYVHLHSAFLRKVINWRPLAPLLRALREAGIIERSFYRVGKHAYGYRLTANHLADSHIRVLPTSRIMKRKLDKFRDEVREQQKARRLPVHDDLQAAQERLTIVLEEATPILSSLENAHARFCQGVLVDNLLERDLTFHVSQYGRLFNAITGIKRRLRHALRLDGETLAALDLSCCQPALIVLLYRGIGPRHDGGKDKSVGESDKSSGVLGKNEATFLTSGDAAEFERLVCDGGFYEELVAETGLERDEVKKSVLRDVLARRGTYTTPVWEVFERRWPSILRFIRSVNRTNHANLIRLLQRAEAWLVVEQVAPLLLDRIPIVTLHDAIYCRERDLSIVKAAFEEAFERIGFRLRLKEEFWGQESMAA